MNESERIYLLERLELLGAEDDAEALQAARELAARVSDSGLDWDDLIAPEDPPDDDFATADYDAEEDGEYDSEDSAEDDEPLEGDGSAEAQLLQKLLERKGNVARVEGRASGNAPGRGIRGGAFEYGPALYPGAGEEAIRQVTPFREQRARCRLRRGPGAAPARRCGSAQCGEPGCVGLGSGLKPAPQRERSRFVSGLKAFDSQVVPGLRMAGLLPERGAERGERLRRDCAGGSRWCALRHNRPEDRPGAALSPPSACTARASASAVSAVRPRPRQVLASTRQPRASSGDVSRCASRRAARRSSSWCCAASPPRSPRGISGRPGRPIPR